MIIDTQETLAVLRRFTKFGALQHVIINADATMTAVYAQGLVQFDAAGKPKKGDAK